MHNYSTKVCRIQPTCLNVILPIFCTSMNSNICQIGKGRNISKNIEYMMSKCKRRRAQVRQNIQETYRQGSEKPNFYKK